MDAMWGCCYLEFEVELFPEQEKGIAVWGCYYLEGLLFGDVRFGTLLQSVELFPDMFEGSPNESPAQMM